MSGTNSNGIHQRHLIWIGMAIAVCVSVAVFLHLEQAGWCKDIINTHCSELDTKFQHLADDIKIIREDVKDIRKEVMSK